MSCVMSVFECVNDLECCCVYRESVKDFTGEQMLGD